jgi:hypothetical protein
MDRRSLIIGLAAGLSASPSFSALSAAPVVVHKDRFCGCCNVWIEHLRNAGFAVSANDAPDMTAVKSKFKVPAALASCHTATVDGYVIEGHVPADAIKRLLKERPTGLGLAVPGMPIGSPGMEAPGTAPEIYDVIFFAEHVQRTFARYRGASLLAD